MIDFAKEHIKHERKSAARLGRFLMEMDMSAEEFYAARLHRPVLTKKDIIDALIDWGIIASVQEDKNYINLVEKIKKKLPVHLQEEILKSE